MKVTISGLKPGKHGFHVHAVSRVARTQPDTAQRPTAPMLPSGASMDARNEPRIDDAAESARPRLMTVALFVFTRVLFAAVR